MHKKLFAILFFGFSSLLADFKPEVQPSPAKAIQLLVEGNQRFADNLSTHPDQTAERRRKTSDMQEPFAIILGCSDSRVSPKIIFDQGIGDLFVVRVAGNVVSPIVLDSIEYSAINLHSAVILVLGHQNCGAVSAVLQGNTKNIEAVASLISVSIKNSENQVGDRLENAIKDNVKQMVKQLQTTPALSQLVEQGKLSITGGYYDFCSGKIELVVPIVNKALL